MCCSRVTTTDRTKRGEERRGVEGQRSHKSLQDPGLCCGRLRTSKKWEAREKQGLLSGLDPSGREKEGSFLTGPSQ
jgi:hypothetical protein